MTEEKVYVTGAPGWLGTRLALGLAGHLPELEAYLPEPGPRTVVCLVHQECPRNTSEISRPGIKTVYGDLADLSSINKFLEDAKGATLYHAAGIIHPSKGVKEFFRTNARGTNNLVSAAVNSGVKRLIHLSSNSPFGFNRLKDEPFTESSPYNPYQGYGHSKMLAEKAVAAAGEMGLETVIVRAPWFHGPGQPDRQSRFFRMVKEGKAPLLGDGENLRSMAYVDNLCQGLLLSEKVEEAAGKAYWIADGKPHMMKEIIDTIERVMADDFNMAVSGKRLRLPGFFGDLAHAADSMLQGLNVYIQEVHVLSEMNKDIFCDISRAKKELGYDPEIDLTEGMRRSIQWMLDNGVEI